MGDIFTEQHLIYSDDVDYKSEARLSGLLSLMQRAADMDVERLGATREEMIAQKMGWMLITMALEIGHIPSAKEAISVQTWNKGPKGALWQRDFRILGEDRKIVAQARSIWALVDIRKRRVLRPSAFPFEISINTGDSAGEAPDKIVIPDGVDLIESYVMTVRYSGIDANGHLNNARYADLCMDALTPDELKMGSVRRFEITYHHEARHGDEIVVMRSELKEGTVYFSGQTREGKHYFDAVMQLAASK